MYIFWFFFKFKIFQLFLKFNGQRRALPLHLVFCISGDHVYILYFWSSWLYSVFKENLNLFCISRELECILYFKRTWMYSVFQENLNIFCISELKHFMHFRRSWIYSEFQENLNIFQRNLIIFFRKIFFISGEHQYILGTSGEHENILYFRRTRKYSVLDKTNLLCVSGEQENIVYFRRKRKYCVLQENT